MNSTMIKKSARTVIFTAAAIIAVFGTTAMAQVEQPSQITVQGTGLMARDSDSNGLTQHTTKTAGGLVGYSYQFATWGSVEGNYGYTRNTLNTFGGSINTSVQTDFHEVMGAFKAHIPVSVHGVRPYALAGGGALVFRPTDNALTINPGLETQTKAALVYGGGVDFDVAQHFGIRAEYRGFVYKAPDFNSTALNLDKITHIAQPSAGFFYRF